MPETGGGRAVGARGNGGVQVSPRMRPAHTSARRGEHTPRKNCLAATVGTSPAVVVDALPVQKGKCFVSAFALNASLVQ